MTELRDCPFCGGEAEAEDYRLFFAVKCSCSACILGDRVSEPETDEEAESIDWDAVRQTAIDRWNGRSDV